MLGACSGSYSGQPGMIVCQTVPAVGCWIGIIRWPYKQPWSIPDDLALSRLDCFMAVMILMLYKCSQIFSLCCSAIFLMPLLYSLLFIQQASKVINSDSSQTPSCISGGIKKGLCFLSNLILIFHQGFDKDYLP